MATVKGERLQIRVDPADKSLLERAAAAAHVNVSAFVLQAAAYRAEEVLAERQSIRLNTQAAIAFGEALERPAQVNERLARALGRHPFDPSLEQGTDLYMLTGEIEATLRRWR